VLAATDVIPALEQVPPALTAALTGIKGRDRKRESTDKNAICLLFLFRKFFTIPSMASDWRLRSHRTYSS